MADNEELQVEDEGEKPKGNKLIIIIAAILLGVGVGAVVVYFFVGGESTEPAQAEAEAVPEVVQSIYYKIEKPFIINYQTKGRQRYLQVSITIRGKDQKAIDALEKHMPVIKSKLNQLFSSQELKTLQTDDGRQQLVAEATKTVQDFLQEEIGSPGIDQVLFTSFVMQ